MWWDLLVDNEFLSILMLQNVSDILMVFWTMIESFLRSKSEGGKRKRFAKQKSPF